MRRVFDIVRHQNPLTLSPDATVQQACQAMRDHIEANFRHLHEERKRRTPPPA